MLFYNMIVLTCPSDKFIIITALNCLIQKYVCEQRLQITWHLLFIWTWRSLNFLHGWRRLCIFYFLVVLNRYSRSFETILSKRILNKRYTIFSIHVEKNPTQFKRKICMLCCKVPFHKYTRGSLQDNYISDQQVNTNI